MTTTRLELIKSANSQHNDQLLQTSTIRNALRFIAEEQNTTAQQLSESVTHLLANIAQTTAAGEPIKLMHLSSVAAFMAGVEAIAKALPNAQDPNKVRSTLRHLHAAKVGSDGFVTTAVAPIAQLGVRKQELMAKYDKMVKDYALSVSRGQANGQVLSAAAKQLQLSIDRAMTGAESPASQPTLAPTRPSAPGTPPANL